MKFTATALRFLAIGILFGLVLVPVFANAQTPPSTMTGSGTTGLQGKVSSPPPTTPATITNPTSGRTFTSTPITVSGLCTTGMVIKIYSNGIFVGSAECKTGSYSLEVDLFGGSNELVARIYDSLDQAGPDSNKVTVEFQDGHAAAFRERVSLSSTIAKLGAPVGSPLTWPLVVTGGTAPYAISIDWGDGSSADLKSVSFAGSFEMTHTYKSAGIYRVVVKASDAEGGAAFLQLVGVGSGAAGQSSTGSKNAGGQSNTIVVQKYIWWPALLTIPFVIAGFWIGKKYELVALHRQLERQSRQYDAEIQT